MAQVFLGWQKVGGIFGMGCFSYCSSDPLPVGARERVPMMGRDSVACSAEEEVPLGFGFVLGLGPQRFDPG